MRDEERAAMAAANKLVQSRGGAVYARSAEAALADRT